MEKEVWAKNAPPLPAPLRILHGYITAEKKYESAHLV